MPTFSKGDLLDWASYSDNPMDPVFGGYHNRILGYLQKATAVGPGHCYLLGFYLLMCTAQVINNTMLDSVIKLAEAPLREMPLMIHDKDVGKLARWRLKIGK